MYELDDYLLIQDDKVVAVSGNSDFEDIEKGLSELYTSKPWIVVQVLEIREPMK